MVDTVEDAKDQLVAYVTSLPASEKNNLAGFARHAQYRDLERNLFDAVYNQTRSAVKPAIDTWVRLDAFRRNGAALGMLGSRLRTEVIRYDFGLASTLAATVGTLSGAVLRSTKNVESASAVAALGLAAAASLSGAAPNSTSMKALEATAARGIERGEKASPSLARTLAARVLPNLPLAPPPPLVRLATTAKLASEAVQASLPQIGVLTNAEADTILTKTANEAKRIIDTQRFDKNNVDEVKADIAWIFGNLVLDELFTDRDRRSLSSSIMPLPRTFSNAFVEDVAVDRSPETARMLALVNESVGDYVLAEHYSRTPAERQTAFHRLDNERSVKWMRELKRWWT